MPWQDLNTPWQDLNVPWGDLDGVVASGPTDPFDPDVWTVFRLTMAINRLPNAYGRIRQMNLFPEQGITTRTVLIEEQNGVLNLLPTQPVGAPGTLGNTGKRKMRSFVIPHIPHDDAVMPEEVQGIRVFGSESQLRGVAQKVLEKLATMRAKHAITLEHLRMGALKGVILDSDGSTLYDLYSQFGITQKTVDFALGTSTTEVREKCTEIRRHIEDTLQGEVMTGIRCLVSSEFYDKLVKHPTVKDAYKYFQQKQNLSGDFRTGFEFGGVFFEEYRGAASDPSGNVRRFIASGEGHAFPEGTSKTFGTYFAPADFNESANTMGLAVYAKQEPRQFGRGMDLHTQSNPLPICARPEVLVKAYSSN